MQFSYWRQPYPLRRDIPYDFSFRNMPSTARLKGDEVGEQLLEWLDIVNVGEQRRYLLRRPILLDSRAEELVAEVLANFELRGNIYYQVREDALLLSTIRGRRTENVGGTEGREEEGREEIERVYIDTYGALAMELPDEFAQIESTLAMFLDDRWRYPRAGERIAWLQEMIKRVYELGSMAELEATLLRELAVAWSEYMLTDRAQAFDRALDYCVEAMQIYTYAKYPRQYAELQILRGNIYMDRTNGNPWDNCAHAIDCQLEALQVFGRERVPVKYAEAQVGLGIAYEFRQNKERREDREQAFVHYQQALEIFTKEHFPYDYARTQLYLISAYWHRILGDKGDNMERALAHAWNVLGVWTRENHPTQYALAQHLLGIVYAERVAGNVHINREKSIFHTRVAAQIFTAETFPVKHGQGLLNLGGMYLMRTAGDRRDNIETAIAYLKAALRIRTRQAFPNEYAVTHIDLGNAYKVRIAGDAAHNRQEAITSFESAAQIWTVEYSPSHAREVQGILGEMYAGCGRWQEAEKAYATALEAENTLIVFGSGTQGRDAVLKDGCRAALYRGYAFSRLGRVEDALVSIEMGRARGMAEGRIFMAAQPELIGDEARRRRYREAREALISAQEELHTSLTGVSDEHGQRLRRLEHIGAYRAAKMTFDALVEEVRAAGDPADFLHASPDMTMVLQAVEHIDSRHILLYLLITPWGGVVIAVLASDLAADNGGKQYSMLDLPDLTEAWMNGLLETRLEDGSERIIGGYMDAQCEMGYQRLLEDWPGATLRAKVQALQVACQACGQVSTLLEAMQDAMQIEEFAHCVDLPLSSLADETAQIMEATFAASFLQCELRRCMTQLGHTLMTPVIAWMREKSLHGMTLVPCGALAAFPLAASLLPGGRTVGETIPTSIAPGARALVRDASVAQRRAGIYALGDPRGDLAWSEAEAMAIEKVARRQHIQVQVQLAEGATREWLLTVLQKGKVIDTCCHGVFDAGDVFNSALYLAHDETMSMGELLSHRVDLRGLRLLMLSACQTAVLDMRGVSDEVHSLASAMMQAGADAVLASLWSVDDRATYLLMVRFAQEWFPRMEQEAPAAALARAQQWLRTLTNERLQRELDADLLRDERSGVASGDGQGRLGVVRRDGQGRLGVVRGTVRRVRLGGQVEGGQRMVTEEAKLTIRMQAESGDPQARPYSDSYYWAGFQLIGW